MREREVADFLLLGGEPLELAFGEKGIQEHQPLDRPRERKGPSVPIVRLADGLVERLVMDVIQPRRVVSAASDRRVIACQQLAKEVLYFLSVRDPRERGVVAT